MALTCSRGGRQGDKDWNVPHYRQGDKDWNVPHYEGFARGAAETLPGGVCRLQEAMMGPMHRALPQLRILVLRIREKTWA